MLKNGKRHYIRWILLIILDEFYTDKNDLISQLSDLQAHENIQKSRPRRFLRRICFEKFRHEKFPSLVRKLQVRGL